MSGSRKSKPAPNQPTEKTDRTPIQEYLAEIGRKGGLKGGHARRDSLSKTRRSEIAKKAAKARWGKS